jgi:fucose 4-O-acetylase-like acetyltransferase
MKNNRIVAIDFLRSISIIIMIMANSAAYVLEKPHSLLLRFIFSLAAPTFIFLSGYSFNISFKNKFSKKDKYLTGIFLFITAGFIDIFIWHIYPFCTFDVLYLIATGIIINTLIANWHYNSKLILILILIVLHLVFLKVTNYRFEITEIEITENPKTVLNIFANDVQMWKRFLLDGWFPVFPWLAFAIAGNVIAERTTSIINNKTIYIITSVFIIFCGILLFINLTPNQLERDDYLELFYPPNAFFIISVTGLLIFSIVFSYKINKTTNKFMLTFCELGKKSLFVYILHSAVISFYISNTGPYNLIEFSMVCILFIVFCVLIVLVMNFLKKKNFFTFVPVIILRILGLK